MNSKSEIKPKLWFVVYTKPRAEKKVAKALLDLNIEHYLPLRNELRQWKDRKKWVEMTLFPSYIFVNIADCDRFSLYEVTGFLKYVSCKGVAVVIAAAEIDKVRHICNYFGIVEIKTDGFIIGEAVLVISGYFIGMKGQLVTKSGQSRIKINIDDLNCCAIIEIDKNCVQKIL